MVLGSKLSSTEANLLRTVLDSARRCPAVTEAGRYPRTKHCDATLPEASHRGDASTVREARRILRRTAEDARPGSDISYSMLAA